MTTQESQRAQEQQPQQQQAPKHPADDARATLLATLPVTERRVDAAGVSTAVLEGGDGPPIVLLHGPGESAFWWMRVIPDLVETHRVVAPDLPDHGASVITDNPLDADSVLAWLDELLARTCPEPPVLVGHILGGAIGARFTTDHEDRLCGLVLVDSLGLGRFRPSPLFAFGLVRFLVHSTERSYDRFLDQCMVDRHRLVEEMGEDWEAFLTYHLDLASNKRTKAAMRTLMKEVGVPVLPAAHLERITVPTTLIWGRHDRANRLGIAENASARYGWPLYAIEDAADDPKLERPAAFLDALRSVLDAEDARTAGTTDV